MLDKFAGLVYTIIRKRKGEPKMRIERNLADGYKLVASNDKHDFYIRKAGKDWYTYAMEKDTNINTTMAGFSTKKAAKNCAFTWLGWMN